MCTVTLIRTDNGIRLVCNRDEQRTRPAAFPPVIRSFGERCAIIPIDPVSDGTWIAATDAGLVLCLLNVNSGESKSKASRLLSRGMVIPSLLHCDSINEALRESRDIRATDYSPFRLVISDGHELVELSSAAESWPEANRRRFETPMMFTSSGLGDHLVEQPRRELFESIFTSDRDPADAQDHFHRHQWPDRPHLSVCMSRSGAGTVSCTAVELSRDEVRMRHVPNTPNRPATPVSLRLPTQRSFVA